MKIDAGESRTLNSDTPVISDSGKVKMGAYSPAFPPVRAAPGTTSDRRNVRLGAYSPVFPPLVRG